MHWLSVIYIYIYILYLYSVLYLFFQPFMKRDIDPSTNTTSINIERERQ